MIIYLSTLDEDMESAFLALVVPNMYLHWFHYQCFCSSLARRKSLVSSTLKIRFSFAMRVNDYFQDYPLYRHFTQQVHHMVRKFAERQTTV